MKKRVKIAITGASGQIGYALLFRVASGEMFGKDTEIELNLLELPVAMASLRGVMMEIEDCAFPLLKEMNAFDNSQQAFKDVDWAVLVGSVPRKKGMERKDLLEINGKIFIEQGRSLDQNAKETCRVLVVGNPCNTNAFIVKSVCKRIPPQNLFAMTTLDQNRAVAQLAQKAKVGVSQIKNLAIWGNHSTTMFPDFSNATIQGVVVGEVIKDKEWLEKTFLEIVQKRGAAIIEARGLSSAASAANAIIDTVRGLSQGTPPGECLSVAVCSDGSYGIAKGLMFSFPIVSNGQDWKIVQDRTLTLFAQEKIKNTEQELLEEKKIVEEIFIN